MKRLQAFLLFIILVFSGASASAGNVETYILGPGDVLQITVWGHEDLTQLVEVRPDGMISFPFVGDLLVDKLTPEAVKNQLTANLAQFVRDPQVTIVVKQFRTIGVQVTGKVKAPGLYRVQPGSRVSDAVALAGGFALDADTDRIRVIAKDGAVTHIELTDQGFSSDLVLTDGDQIIVPRLYMVTVVGQVRTPGRVMLLPKSRLSDAIAVAGGVSPEADLSRVRLVSRDGNPQVVDLTGFFREGVLTGNLELADGDQVVIPELRKVTVLGEVKQPGLVPVANGDNLLDILAGAGGATTEANLAQVEVKSFTGDTLIGTDLVNLGVQSAKIQVDVPHNGRLIVTVPKIVRQVTVLGEVVRPGTYPIAEESRLMQVIGAAGGPTDRASLAEVRVYRGGELSDPEDVVLGRDRLLFEGSIEENIPVTAGDVVFVPETAKVNWDKVIKLLTGLTLVKDLLQ